MRCPFCNQDNTRVVDSRPVEDTNSIRRRRLCDACGKRFTTYEKVETIPLTVIKKDQNRENFAGVFPKKMNIPFHGTASARSAKISSLLISVMKNCCPENKYLLIVKALYFLYFP